MNILVIFGLLVFGIIVTILVLNLLSKFSPSSVLDSEETIVVCKTDENTGKRRVDSSKKHWYSFLFN